MGVREDIVRCAEEYLGVPYKSIYGGTGPEDGGFTCSGLTWRAYHDAGVVIPVAQGIHSYYTGSYNGWDTQCGWTLSNGHWTEDEDELVVECFLFVFGFRLLCGAFSFRPVKFGYFCGYFRYFLFVSGYAAMFGEHGTAVVAKFSHYR